MSDQAVLVLTLQAKLDTLSSCTFFSPFRICLCNKPCFRVHTLCVRISLSFRSARTAGPRTSRGGGRGREQRRRRGRPCRRRRAGCRQGRRRPARRSGCRCCRPCSTAGPPRPAAPPGTPAAPPSSWQTPCTHSPCRGGRRRMPALC
uniref:Uncharacterized protein n=1 Tax=Arundo donax TaxID=35708 RepID=A0A0A9G5M9_ARUDO